MMFGIGARSAVGARDRGDRRSGQFWPSASNPKPNESRSRSLPIGRLGVQDPLVIAAIGIAVGAAIGAVLPASATENELMGTMSSSARRAAREVAEDEMKHLKDSVSRTVESVKQSAAERGLSSDNLSEAVRAAGEQVKAAAHEAIADAGQPKTEK